MQKKLHANIKPITINAGKTPISRVKLKLDNRKPIKYDDNSADTKVSVITCTNRPKYIKNVFENYHRQLFKDKELIIILNNNKMNINEWILKSKEYPDISIFQVDESKSLGYCLNYGIEKASYEIIAKLDDDDYYGPKYLSQAVNALKYADVVGKYTTYVYFQDTKTLAIRNPKRDNRYVYRIEGPTLVFRKEIFNKIKFQNKSLGEDNQFCKDCIKNGIKLYATDRYNYVYIRHNSTDKHAWNIRDELYKKLCKVIGEVDDYISFIEDSKNRNKNSQKKNRPP
ncbi:glycosyltransferase family A protein [Proteiniborus sp. MB09-C3]|uniref:glycosyltransferase n=1 Tax=Proteiniborus sp. MB09-C3 TaxID=3050072 RepID=UPI0025527071|nr:glycosyltransferase family A protein [Proteiniborus sp. MB09-C3]WIV11199.1 glycosyltransferase family A protein [Proteiniborus sp. MB09-C3]